MTLRGTTISEIPALAARLLVGGVLAYAGFMKAAGPSAEFAAVLAAYQLFPPSLVSPLAMGVPYLEMWTGLFVLAGLYTRRSATAAAALYSIFLLVLGITLLRGIDLASCGCFGADALSPRSTLIMDAVLVALSLWVRRCSKSPPLMSLDRSLT